MNEPQNFWKRNKNALLIGGGIALFTGGVVGLRSFKAIDSGHFGVHTRLGKVLSDTLHPGIVGKNPFLDKVHEFQNNTIILETTAGEGRNTKDQNMLSSEMRLHYKIDPTQGVLALHIDDMSDDNGEKLLDKLMTQSFNAVVGKRAAADHMADPKALLQAFAENLEWREKQNNVPITVEAIELLTATVGNGTDPYRMPVQLRMRRIEKDGKAGWAIEEMAGPAALPVQSAGQTIKPDERQPIQDTPKLQLK